MILQFVLFMKEILAVITLDGMVDVLIIGIDKLEK